MFVFSSKSHELHPSMPLFTASTDSALSLNITKSTQKMSPVLLQSSITFSYCFGRLYSAEEALIPYLLSKNLGSCFNIVDVIINTPFISLILTSYWHQQPDCTAKSARRRKSCVKDQINLLELIQLRTTHIEGSTGVLTHAVLNALALTYLLTYVL